MFKQGNNPDAVKRVSNLKKKYCSQCYHDRGVLVEMYIANVVEGGPAVGGDTLIYNCPTPGCGHQKAFNNRDAVRAYAAAKKAGKVKHEEGGKYE